MYNNLEYKDLPFRPGVGMMIINKENRIFVGKRLNTKDNAWQMPQGGIDLGETPSVAAIREMKEEIGSDNCKIIAESKNWYSYRIPEFLVPKLWGGKFCGQKQKWFLIRFLGSDEDININTECPEFEEWKWIDAKDLLQDVIQFKIVLYKRIIEEFSSFISNETN
ncbi:MAG TPA: RNA pyrophosphohydrolase [Candidatus Megaira endosymbiont of Nemacystus decipiens]|nr:RNA pyrophosphohydrolase [Candidatus Megaera endosymbiont of Nemacystus decipiens]